MEFKCPKCGEVMNISDEQLQATGYQTVCPQCASPLKIEGEFAYIPLAEAPAQEQGPVQSVEFESIESQQPVDVPVVELDDDETPPPFRGDTAGKHPLFDDAVAYIKTCSAISVPRLKDYFGITQEEAAELMRQLEENGIVGPYQGGAPRKILIEHNAGLPSAFEGRRTYEQDKQMDFLRREMERLQQGEHPQVKTYGCSCFSVLLIAMAIYLLFQLFR